MFPSWWGFEPHLSALAGEIWHIWSFWGPSLLIPIQKWPPFDHDFKNISSNHGAEKGLTRGKRHRRIWIFKFQEIWGSLWRHKRGLKKNVPIFLPEVTFGVNAPWLLDQFQNGKNFTRANSSANLITKFGIGYRLQGLRAGALKMGVNFCLPHFAR